MSSLWQLFVSLHHLTLTLSLQRQSRILETHKLLYCYYGDSHNYNNRPTCTCTFVMKTGIEQSIFAILPMSMKIELRKVPCYKKYGYIHTIEGPIKKQQQSSQFTKCTVFVKYSLHSHTRISSLFDLLYT